MPGSTRYFGRAKNFAAAGPKTIAYGRRPKPARENSPSWHRRKRRGRIAAATDGEAGHLALQRPPASHVPATQPAAAAPAPPIAAGTPAPISAPPRRHRITLARLRAVFAESASPLSRKIAALKLQAQGYSKTAAYNALRRFAHCLEAQLGSQLAWKLGA